MTRWFWLGVVALAAACGSGGGTADGAPHGDGRRSDSTVAPICHAASSYAGPLVDQTATHDDIDGIDLLYLAAGTLAADLDQFQLQLYAMAGVFTGGTVEPGTYELRGDEIQYETCGACALIFAEYSAEEADFADPDRIYLASAGSVTIATVTPNLSGTVDNLLLNHVTIDVDNAYHSTVVGDCQTTIPSLAFDALVVETPLIGTPITLPLRRKP